MGSKHTPWTSYLTGMGSLYTTYTMVQMGRGGHCGLPMAWDPWDTSMGSLGYIYGILAYTMVQMCRDGHCGLPTAKDP